MGNILRSGERFYLFVGFHLISNLLDPRDCPLKCAKFFGVAICIDDHHE